MSEFVLDVRALSRWASMTGNEFGAIAAAIQDGRICLFARVWQDFCEMYPDEAEAITADANPRRRMTPADRLNASALADHVEASFGPYDDGSDWIVAGAAVAEEMLVVTTHPLPVDFYGQIDGCCAITVDELIEQLS